MTESTFSGGIPCPQCGSLHRQIKESRRRVSGAIYRRCRCLNCGHPFTTYERLADEQPHVVAQVMAKVRDRFDKLDEQLKQIEAMVEDTLSTSSR